MILRRNQEIQFTFKAFCIVLSCIFLSKSLYFETYGNNLLLGVFLFFLIFTVKPSKLKINKYVLLYVVSFVLLVGLNTETKLSSLVVLILRVAVAIYVVHSLTFKEFSVIYTKIILFICTFSFLYVFVLYFNISSLLPDFVGLDERPLRNFLIFGVSENFVKYSIYRNSGLWWEPGAFQLFINLAFIFALTNKQITIKMYIIFSLAILSTLSTTGVLVFFILSTIYWRDIVENNRNRFFFILLGLVFLTAFAIVGIPFILIKFGAGDIAEVSVSFLSRYYDFVISFNMLKDNFLLGYGFGSQIENAIPYGIDLMGKVKYELIRPTGADGLTMFVAQVGILSLVFLVPFIFPKYLGAMSVFNRLLIALSLIIMFNTQNLTFHLIFTLLMFYGVVGNKNPVKKTNLSTKNGNRFFAVFQDEKMWCYKAD